MTKTASHIKYSSTKLRKKKRERKEGREGRGGEGRKDRWMDLNEGALLSEAHQAFGLF